MGCMVSMLLTFLGVSIVLTALPGPDSLLVVRSGLRGRARATAVGAGTAIAALGWGVAAAFGVAIVLQRSAVAFEVVKLAGAVYLIGLGLHTFWATRRGNPAPPTAAAEADPTGGGTWAGLRTGLVAGLLNPKTGLFYVAVLPQILPKGAAVLPATLTFAGVDAVVVVLYTALLAALATLLLRYLRRPKVLRYAERTTGACLIGLGARAAFER